MTEQRNSSAWDRWAVVTNHLTGQYKEEVKAMRDRNGLTSYLFLIGAFSYEEGGSDYLRRVLVNHKMISR